MHGFLLIDKPQRWTSHDVIAKLRGVLKTKRIGHGGTLDPMATGLLVIAVGQATRLLQYVNLEPKEYEGTIRLGEETDTQDADGKVVAQASTHGIGVDAVTAAARRMLGDSDQVPPMYSAVKVGGTPLYKRARRGEYVERAPRRIAVHELDVLSFAPPSIAFRVVCSGGTYVRTLAHDIGKALGCGAHLSALRRLRVGRMSVAAAVTMDASDFPLIPLSDALAPIPAIEIPHDTAQRLRHGLDAQIAADGDRILTHEGACFPVAFCLRVGESWQPKVVFPPPEATSERDRE
jgi:tRNA pseudouridine55 synthase